MAKEVLEMEVKSNIGEVTKDTKKLTNEASNAAGEFQVMGVSLNGVKAAFSSAGKSAKLMFGSIKAGLISTGIGIFLVAIGALVQYFKDSEEGASKLKEILSQIGVVVGNITDIVSNLGKSFFKLLTGDFAGFKEGLAEVTQGVKDFGETTKREMGMAKQLEKDRLALQKFERKAMVDKAKTEKDMMELRLKARDFEKFSAEERLGFMREANKLAAEQLEKDLFVAKEKLRFQVEENSYSKSTQQNLDDEAALQAAVFNLERSNFSERKRLKSEEQAIVKEIAASNKQIAADAQKIVDDEFAVMVKANDEWNKKQIADAKMVADAKIKETKRVADLEKQISIAVESFKKATIQQGFGAAAAMAGENVALSKGVAAAQVIYNTQQGIMAAMGATSVADKLLPFPLRLVNAISTGVMGAAALSTIMSTNPKGGGSMPAPSTGGGGTPAPQMMSGAFDISGGVAPEATKAFVVTDEMSNSQNQLANIRRRATI